MTYMDVGNVNVDARFSGRNEMSPVSPYLVLRYTLAKFELINEGDDSGTHKKELQLWQHLGALPAFEGYLESGRGMGHSLHMASEMGAYTLSDRGTWLALKDKLELRLVLESDPQLLNPYQVMLVNPKRHSHANINLAREFAQWMVSSTGQGAIGDFRINGEVLFVPSAR